MLKTPIFLIGFMGVGKTTLGKKLARKLSIDFIDSDEALELKLACSIADYFESEGEESFRKEEQIWLNELTSEPKIIATGGGMPCFYDNMKVLNQKGVTIYLERPAKELYQRLVNAKEQRPLVKKLNNEELLQFIEQKLQEREKYYQQAKYILNREEQTVEGILNCLTSNI